MTLLQWRKTDVFQNCEHISNQLRLLISGPSGTGKSALLLRLLTNICPIHNKEFLDYQTLILVSPSLSQSEYQIIIKAFNAGLCKSQIIKLFEVQNKITDIDLAVK